MDFQDILYTKENGMAIITLNRPETLNAFTPRMEREWLEALKDADKDPAVKVIIITGAGRAFCSGGNPRDLLASREYFLKMGKWVTAPELDELARTALNLSKPYIAAINGPCVGGGWEMVSLCDIRIASEKARIGTGFIRMGEVPSSLGCYILPRLVGLPRALEWLWTGKIIDAEEAYRIGFVNQVVPHEELMPTVKSLALRLIRGPGVAIREIRKLVYRCLSLSPEEAILAHREASRIVCATEDAQEGPRAWIEKREPLFKGR